MWGERRRGGCGERGLRMFSFVVWMGFLVRVIENWGPMGEDMREDLCYAPSSPCVKKRSAEGKGVERETSLEGTNKRCISWEESKDEGLIWV